MKNCRSNSTILNYFESYQKSCTGALKRSFSRLYISARWLAVPMMASVHQFKGGSIELSSSWSVLHAFNHSLVEAGMKNNDRI